MAESKPLLMVVDDNQDILFNIKILLEAKGYEVKTATSGEMALTMLSSGENPPEVIISDIMMPNMNGQQVLDAIQGNLKWKNIPIFIITVVKDSDFKKSAEELGISYIEKPFTKDMLIGKINSYFNTR